MFMRVRISIVLAALAVSLVLPAAVGARSNAAAQAASAADAAVLAYWTPARIANAKWKSYVRDEKGQFKPYARPGGSGGAVTGASWAGGGDIQNRSGRILFSSGGSDWICSGSVVNDGSGAGAVILTAGHCVFDGADGWSYNFLYMPNFDAEPNYDCATRNLGCWRADRLVANKAFVDGGGFGTNATVAVDYGLAHVGARLNGSTQVDGLYGGYAINTTALNNSATQWAFGYPAAGRYKGKDLIYCMGSTIADPNGANTWGVACNMNGGASGGPWITGTTDPHVATTATKLSSVNSYGYSGLTYMFGPKLDGTTVTVAGDASDGTQTNGTDYVCTVATTENTSCPG